MRQLVHDDYVKWQESECCNQCGGTDLNIRLCQQKKPAYKKWRFTCANCKHVWDGPNWVKYTEQA